MTRPPEPPPSPTKATAQTRQPTPEVQQDAATTFPPTVYRLPAPELSEAERKTARQLLAAIFITAGIAHLTHQRFYRSLLPYWLLEARREIDVATGTVEVFGGVLLCIPRLRKLARWTNLAVLAPELLAAIGEARQPERLRRFSQRHAVLNPIGPLALAPGHAGLAGVLWWATQGQPTDGRRPAHLPHMEQPGTVVRARLRPNGGDHASG